MKVGLPFRKAVTELAGRRAQPCGGARVVIPVAGHIAEAIMTA